MTYAAIILFALAAVGGLVLATRHIKGEVPPMGLALAHGGLAATALVLLLAAVATGVAAGTAFNASVAAFLVAALGGFYLFSRRFAAGKATVGVIGIHALVAVGGFLVLLVAVFL